MLNALQILIPSANFGNSVKRKKKKVAKGAFPVFQSIFILYVAMKLTAVLEAYVFVYNFFLVPLIG